MNRLQDIITDLYGRYIVACSAAGIKPLDDRWMFEYNIASGTGDRYITQLESTNKRACIDLAEQIISIISRI